MSREGFPRDLATEEAMWKGPDWTCPRCGFVNMSIRERCRNFIQCGWDSALVSEGVMLDPEGAK